MKAFTRGKKNKTEFMIDEDSYNSIKDKFELYAIESRNGEKYIVCFKNGKYVSTLQRVLLGLGKNDKRQADHINRNPLDNRMSNLRIASIKQQRANQGMRKDNKTGCRGVYFREDRKIFRARIHGKHLGHFKSKKEASEAYYRELEKEYGVFAPSKNDCVKEMQNVK